MTLKILIIRLSALGDTIHSLPVAAAIKARIPDAEISWLVESQYAPLLHGNPAVDKVIALPTLLSSKVLSKPWLWARASARLVAFSSRLRANRFHAVIDLQGLLKSAVWAGVCGSPIRIGFAQAREGSRHFLTHALANGDYFGHDRPVVQLNLDMVDFLCQIVRSPTVQIAAAPAAVEFPLPATPVPSISKIEQLLTADRGKESQALNAVFIPGTTWHSKIWPQQSWAELAKLVGERLGYRICLIGAGQAAPANAYIRSFLVRESPQIKVFDLSDNTSLLDLLALFEKSHLVVGADCGPLHLAAAVGKPKVVGIYGSTPVKRNGPYGRQCRAISLGLWCQPCYKKVCPLSNTACLHNLSVESVFASIEEHLQDSR